MYTIVVWYILHVWIFSLHYVVYCKHWEKLNILAPRVVFSFQDNAVQCHCFNDTGNLLHGNKSTCTEKCNQYVCGSANGLDLSVYKRVAAEPG